MPTGTPAAAIERLREAARATAQDAKANQVMVGAGTSFQYQDAPDFERFVQQDAQTMAKVVQGIGQVN